jgi:hypothetical protein
MANPAAAIAPCVRAEFALANVPHIPGMRPLDRHARDGRTKLVTDGARFALVRWTNGEWRFPFTATRLDFTPTEYQG